MKKSTIIDVIFVVLMMVAMATVFVAAMSMITVNV